MKRKLPRQICNEWRSNLWLAIELLLVSVIIWYVTVSIFSTLWALTESPGYDINGVYRIGHSIIPESSPMYKADRGSDEALDHDFVEMQRRLREAPGVEALALSSNGIPYNYNRSGWNATLVSSQNPDSTFEKFFVTKIVSPSYPIVMQMHGYNGETPEELAEFLRKDGFMVTANTFDDHQEIYSKAPEHIAEDWRNYYGPGSSAPLKVLPNLRRNDYEPATSSTMIYRYMSEEGGTPPDFVGEITVRVTPGMEREFTEWIDSHMGSYLSVGNVYVNDLESVENIRAENQRDIREFVQNRIACIIFLMISIFLGLLGTFWFRTQQRVSEIAIRKVNGATSNMIFMRLISEGLLLLTTVTPLALVIDWLLIKNDLIQTTFVPLSTWQYVVSAIIAFGLLVLMIVLGVWFPARRAMKVDPARALADE